MLTIKRPPMLETKRIDQGLNLKPVSSQDALALAYAAHRINGNQYIKETRRFSTEGNDPIYSNKEIVKYTLASQRNEWIPDDFTPVVVTAEDYESVEDCKNHFKRYTMLALGDITEFQQNMFEIVKQNEHRYLDGRIAFIPQFVENERKENALKKKIRMDYRNSVHLGKEKDEVDGVVKILEARWSNQFERWNYNGVIDGNLVSFMNANNHEVGSVKRIKGKIKSLQDNKLFKVPETRLNYVKLSKV